MCNLPILSQTISTSRKNDLQRAAATRYLSWRNRTSLVMWVDGSAQSRPATSECLPSRITAAAVGYRHPSSKSWVEFVTLNTLGQGPHRALQTEFIAIHEAFRVASKLTSHFDHLLIFSDCQVVLNKLPTQSIFDYVPKKWIHNLFRHANSLSDLGITVDLQWVPKFCRVEGHVRVDRLARKTRTSSKKYYAPRSHRS
jgi:ribonuclease HI